MSKQELVIEDPSYNKFKAGNAQRTRNYLIAVCFVLLILAVIFISLFAMEREKVKLIKSQSGQSSGSVATTVSPHIPQTFSPQSVAVAAAVYNRMDMSADPCEDFYQYACGTWIKKTPIPDSKTSYSSFSVVGDKNILVLKQAIQEIAANKASASNDAIRKAVDYYKACMDTKTILAKGDAPLKDMISKYGSWPISDPSFNESTWDFTKAFTLIHKELAFTPIFNMYIGVDIKNSGQNSIIFGETSPVISRSNYVGNSTYNKKVRTGYRTLMKSLVKLLGANDTQAEIMDKELFNLEKQFAEIMLTVSEKRDYGKLYKAMPLKQFANETGIELSWLVTFLNECFKPSQPINGDERIITYSIDYIKKAWKLFNQQSIRLKATYMMWPVIYSMAPSLLGDYGAVFREFSSSISGTVASDPRWRSCISASTNTYGYAVGSLFVERTFTKKAKKSAEEMIDGVQKVFVDNLKGLNWMDDATKKAAEDKAKAIKNNVGYPEFITDKSAIENYYKGLESKPNQYFENILEKRKYSNLKNYERRGKPIDKTQWSTIPSTVNAFYSGTRNIIVFPAGILQSPFYDEEAPRALNYGAIGMVVGHEVTHGFDDQGRKYDKTGDLNSWWSKSSEANFKQKSQCLVDQYSKFSLYNTSVNGAQNLGENIADNGGIKAAFQAYERFIKENGAEKELPGLGLTSEQLFFIGFGQVWCGAYRESATVNLIENGVHSPSIFRVTGTLQNSEEFAKSYSCKSGSRMNPVKKCKLW